MLRKKEYCPTYTSGYDETAVTADAQDCGIQESEIDEFYGHWNKYHCIYGSPANTIGRPSNTVSAGTSRSTDTLAKLSVAAHDSDISEELDKP